MCGDTVLSKEEHKKLFYNQQSTLEVPTFIEIVMSDDKYEYDEPALKIVEEPAPHVVEKKPITPNSTRSKTFYAATAQKYDKSEIDLSGAVGGARVRHKSTIAWIDKADIHIQVKFDAGEKTFIAYAFRKGFLSL